MVENNKTISAVDEDKVAVIDDRIIIIKKSDWDRLNYNYQRLSDDLNQLRCDVEDVKRRA